MTLWAIVPVKPLRRGKSRLAGLLSEEERTDLNRHMLERTLVTLGEVSQIEQVLVVSRDPHALTVARAHGARTLREHGQPHLNTALQRATVVAQVYSTRGILVLPADLPLVTAEEVRQLIARATDPPVVVIAPDRRAKGTNALLLAPAGIMEYDFGEDSFRRHRERAERAGARVEIVRLPSIELDLDWPEDFELVQDRAQDAKEEA